jgi:hypothetical protein
MINEQCSKGGPSFLKRKNIVEADLGLSENRAPHYHWFPTSSYVGDSSRHFQTEEFLVIHSPPVGEIVS